MKTFVLSPAGKQPLKIASHIELGKKKSGKDINVRAIVKALAKRLKKVLTLQRVATAVGCVSALTAWFAAIIYDTTESQTALITLAISSLLGVLSLAPIFFDPPTLTIPRHNH